MKKSLILFFSILFLLPHCSSKKVDSAQEINLVTQIELVDQTFNLITPYGNFTITEPVIIDLIKHPIMQRLKKIRQYGVNYFVIKPEEYHRFEHSLGVFALLRKCGASLNEQIAGLLHDVSHTVFSHVGDWVFDHPDGKSSYQDDHHEEFLRRSGLADVLAFHGFTVEDIHHKNKAFTCMDCDLPDLCADRIEYNLQGGVREHLITEQEFDAMVNDLHFVDGKWYLTDPALARKLGDISLFHTEHVWTSPWGLLVYDLTGKALKAGLNAGCFTPDDIHFGTDDETWQRLNACPNAQVQELMKQIKNYKKLYRVIDTAQADFIVYGKCRGVDPLIKQGDTLVRLSTIDHEYATKLKTLQQKMDVGWGIKRTFNLIRCNSSKLAS